jgi:hypothetical protein
MRTLSPVRLCGAAAATLIIFLQPLSSARSADRELSDMVRIGAGEFLMGTNDGPEDERPMHRVSVAEFSIDRHQVTNAQFARFLDAVGTESARREKYFDIDDDDARVHRRSGRWLADQGHENRPVVEVSWFGAVAFCNWVGKRLPTEAEWERTARGLDGRKFPWGSEPPDATRAHFNAGWPGRFDPAARARHTGRRPGLTRRRVDYNSSRSTGLAQFSFGASQYWISLRPLNIFRRQRSNAVIFRDRGHADRNRGRRARGSTGLVVYQSRAHVNGLLSAYVTTFLLTISNPATLFSFIAIYAGWHVPSLHGHYFAAALLTAGVFSGSALWWVGLFIGLTIFHDKFSLRFLFWIHRVSGAVIAVFGFVVLLSLTPLSKILGLEF